MEDGIHSDGSSPRFPFVLVQRESGELALPVSEYTAIFGGPVWTTPPNEVAAGGSGTLLKVQLVSKRNQVGWFPIHTPFTQGAYAKRNWLGKGINLGPNAQTPARSSRKLWAQIQEDGKTVSGEIAPQRHLGYRVRLSGPSCPYRPVSGKLVLGPDPAGCGGQCW